MKAAVPILCLLTACVPLPMRPAWERAQMMQCAPLPHVGCCEQRARALQRALRAVGIESKLEVWCTGGRLHMLVRVGAMVLDPTTGDVLDWQEGFIVWREA
jgi:hypothetical protein